MTRRDVHSPPPPGHAAYAPLSLSGCAGLDVKLLNDPNLDLRLLTSPGLFHIVSADQ